MKTILLLFTSLAYTTFSFSQTASSTFLTWMKGDNTINQAGIYGTQGIVDTVNKPGARDFSATWKDNNGNLWLFGGYGYDENSSGYLNDLWKYNPSVNQWTWVKGNNTIEQFGVYGTQGVAKATNKPGAIYSGVSWTDSNGNLWLFGGFGYTETDFGFLNDLWKFNPATNKWTWVKGDNKVDQLGIYGARGIPSGLNKSGSRTSCVSWTDGSGDLWLFGGYGYAASTSGILNDLWKISNFQVLPLQLLHFGGVLNNNVADLQWQTAQELNFSHFIVQRSFDGTNFSAIGNVNCLGNIDKTNYSFTDDLHSRTEEKVFYRLQLLDKDGRFTYSKIIRFDRTQGYLTLHIFPNPVANSLILSFDQNKAGKAEINITDMNGISVIKQRENISAGRAGITIDVSVLPSATYILSVTNASGTTQQKFLKQ